MLRSVRTMFLSKVHTKYIVPPMDKKQRACDESPDKHSDNDQKAAKTLRHMGGRVLAGPTGWSPHRSSARCRPPKTFGDAARRKAFTRLCRDRNGERPAT